MAEVLDIVLLLALPASGKSEVRRYLASLAPEVVRRDFHLGPTVQLDDFPYVHLMRRLDELLLDRQERALFFSAPDRSFRDARDWGTLVELLNEDYANLLIVSHPDPQSAATPAMAFFQRLDRAAQKVGISPRLAELSPTLLNWLASQLNEEIAQANEGRPKPSSLAGKTVVIEFARGGAALAPMPLPAPFGYAYSLARLSPEILSRASILYVWVTPEESRRKNRDRTDPNDPGSILHHGVPEHVMWNDYGCDDFEWLLANARKPATIRIEAHGNEYDLPIGRFDNRIDKTSFVRKEENQWAAAERELLHDGLREAFDAICSSR